MEINERFETRQQQQANKKRNKKETEQDCTFRIIVHDWSSVHQSTRHRNRRFIPIDGCIGTEMELADAIINLTPTSTVEHLGASRSISEHLGASRSISEHLGEGQESTGAVRHQRRAADAGGKRGGSAPLAPSLDRFENHRPLGIHPSAINYSKWMETVPKPKLIQATPRWKADPSPVKFHPIECY